MRKLQIALSQALLLALPAVVACGGGIPITVRIDEFEPLVLNLDEAVGTLEQQIVEQGFLPGELRALPEEWPDSLPHIHFETAFRSPPQQIDLTPEDEEAAAKYEEINAVEDAIERIELNELVLRVEQNSATVAIPALRLEIAGDPNADPELRTAWEVIGRIPGADPRTVTDLRLEYVPGGESLFNLELGDEDKDLAVRVAATLRYCTDELSDSACSRLRPQGTMRIRIIAVVTFFVEPGAIDYETLN